MPSRTPPKYPNVVINNGIAYHRQRHTITDVLGKKQRQTRLTRIEGEIGSPAFLRNLARIQEHEAAKAPDDNSSEQSTSYKTNSVAWLITLYKKSGRYGKLKPRTLRDYDRQLDYIIENYGHADWTKLTTAKLTELMHDLALNSKRNANQFHIVMSILGSFAVTLKIRFDNPASGIKKFSLKNVRDTNAKTQPSEMGGANDEWRAWAPEERWWFEGLVDKKVCEIAYWLGIYTGQREEDVIQMRWSDRFVDEEDRHWIDVTQNKGGKPMSIPEHPKLTKILNEWRLEQDLRKAKIQKGRARKRKAPNTWSDHIVTGERCTSLTVDGFRSNWYKCLKKMGLSRANNDRFGNTFHGLRKNATAALLEAECSRDQIKAITGHSTDQMVDHYGRDARQKKLAASAMRKMSKAETETSSQLRQTKRRPVQYYED